LNALRSHQIWIEQCDAAEDIKLRYGLKAAFDYVVAEKLLNFAKAAADHPEFARELPRFVSRVRGLFTPQEMRTHLDRIEREQQQYDDSVEEDDEAEEDQVLEDDEMLLESAAATAERARQFATIKELLTAVELGTS
jgi:hypothetical protein